MREANPNEHKNKLLKYLALLIVAGALVGLFFYAKNAGWIEVDRIRGFIEQAGPWGPVVYFLIYVAVALSGLSAAAITILGGTLFGPWLGLLLAVTAATSAAAIAFFGARYLAHFFLRETAAAGKQHGLLGKLKHKIETNAEQRGFAVIALMRLSFLPYIPLSYAAGLVKNLKASDFILATFLTNIFGSGVFIFLGASLTKNWPLVLAAIVLVIAFMQIPKLIAKYNPEAVEEQK